MERPTWAWARERMRARARASNSGRAIGLAPVLALGVALGAAAPAWTADGAPASGAVADPTPARAADARPLRLAGGEPGGAYHAVSEALAHALRTADGLAAEVLDARGSVDHVRLLSAGEADAALVQGDVLLDAWEGRGAFAEPVKALRALGAAFPEAVHVLARPALGARTVADLRGRTIAVGATGSGSSQSARRVLDLHGLGADDVSLRPLGTAEAVEALRRGEIDALVATALAPNERVAALLAAGEAALLPLAPEALARVGKGLPGLRALALDQAIYPGLAAPVDVVGVEAVLVVRESLPAVTAAALAERLASDDGRAALRAARAGAGAYGCVDAADRAPIPLHAGALDYYRSADAFERPVRVSVGLIVLAVTDLDMKSGTFMADMYIWFRWRGRLGAEDDAFPFELANGAITNREVNTVERVGGLQYVCYRVQAQMRGQFLLHDYPFDHQRLEVQIEASEHGNDEVVFVADDLDVQGKPRDLRTAGIGASVSISDWRIASVGQRVIDYVYPTDFGSPEEALRGRKAFARLVFTIEVDRVLFPYLVKVCLPLVIIVLMAFSVFFIKAREFEVQAGIVITALLSVVAFHVSQADSLPEVGYLVTADKFFLLAYVVIFLTLVEVVWENRIFHTRGEDAAERIDRWARRLFPAAFFGPVGYMILSRL